MGYTKEVIKGISWLGAFRSFSRVISLVRTAVIARLLTPIQFGAFGIAALVLSFTEILTETGINIILIQRKEGVDRYVNTAWVVSIVRGFLVSLVIFAVTPFVSHFFNSQESYKLLLLISIVPSIRGFINPSVARFIKDLKFSYEFYYRSSIFFIESVITLTVVYLLRSPEALVWGLLAGALYEVILSFLMIKPIPSFHFDYTIFREIIGRGKWLTFTAIFNYLYHNADDAFVGKILGISPLGLYDMAYKISMLPISEVSDVISKATFPVFVKISHDRERLKNAFLKSITLVSLLVVPMGIILFLFPEFIIRLLLGSQWTSAAPVLQVLALFGVIRAISISAVAPIYGIEKQEMVTVITFISLVGMLITIVPFINIWGLIGAGFSVLFGASITIPIVAYYLYKVFYKT